MRPRTAVVASLLTLLVLGLMAPVVSAQTNSPGGQQPGDSTPAPEADVPRNESGTVPAGGATGGGSGAPATDAGGGGSSKAPFVVVAVLVGLAVVGFVVRRQRRLEHVGAD
jgi:uncharacterized membrane protein